MLKKEISSAMLNNKYNLNFINTRPNSAMRSNKYYLKVNTSNCSYVNPPPIIFTSPKNKRPKNMGNKMEKEELYENNMQLKKSISKMQKELAQTKFQVVKRGMELQAKEKILRECLKENDIEIDHQMKLDRGRESAVITLYKEKYISLKKKYDEECRINKVLKSNITNSKIKEYQIENDVLSKEISKIKSLYQQSQENVEKLNKTVQELYFLKDKLIEQHKIISTFSKKNELLNKEISILKQDNYDLTFKLEINNRKKEKLLIWNDKLKIKNFQYLNNRKINENYMLKNDDNVRKIRDLKKELSEVKMAFNKKVFDYDELKKNFNSCQDKLNNSSTNILKPFNHKKVKYFEKDPSFKDIDKLELYKSLYNESQLKIGIYEKYLKENNINPKNITKKYGYNGILSSDNKSLYNKIDINNSVPKIIKEDKEKGNIILALNNIKNEKGNDKDKIIITDSSKEKDKNIKIKNSNNNKIKETDKDINIGIKENGIKLNNDKKDSNDIKEKKDKNYIENNNNVKEEKKVNINNENINKNDVNLKEGNNYINDKKEYNDKEKDEKDNENKKENANINNDDEISDEYNDFIENKKSENDDTKKEINNKNNESEKKKNLKRNPSSDELINSRKSEELISNQFSKTNSNYNITSSEVEDKNIDLSNEEIENKFIPLIHIFIKNFEANNCTINILENKLKEIHKTFEGKEKLNKDEFLSPFINLFVESMKVTKENDIQIIKSFFNEYIDNINGNTSQFFNDLIKIFKNINDYSKVEMTEDLLNSLAYNLQKHQPDLENRIKEDDMTGSKLLTFDIFQKIVSELGISLNDQIMEYLLFKMKKDTPENNSIFDLNYDFVINLLKRKIPDEIKKNEDIGQKLSDKLSDFKNNMLNEDTDLEQVFKDKIKRINNEDKIYEVVEKDVFFDMMEQYGVKVSDEIKDVIYHVFIIEEPCCTDDGKIQMMDYIKLKKLFLNDFYTE